MKGLSWRNIKSDERGATAAMYALALPALVAVAGIGFDYAQLASLDTELQNAADQAALAGATQLDQSSGAISRAIDAVQGGLVANETFFANDGQGTGIDVPTNQIYFYETKVDAEAGTNPVDTTAADADTKANFIRVVVETRTANYALTPVVGAFSGTIDAEAVAGIGSALCRTPPLMICNPNEPDDGVGDENATFNADNYKGYGLLQKKGGGGAWEPGNFGFLDIGLGNGATGVKQALGWDTYPGACTATYGGVDTVDTQTGNIAVATDLLNTRFDIYDAGCETGGNCPASINSRKDVVRASDSTSCGFNSSTSTEWTLPPLANRYMPTSGSVPLTDAQADAIDAMGHPRDMCHAIADGGVCGTAGNPFGDGLWDRNAYFRVNYRRTEDGSRGLEGEPWDSTDWPVNTGLGANATRFEVYEWEIENEGDLIDGVRVLEPVPSASGSTLVDHGTPICSAAEGFGSGIDPTSGAPDRRRVSVAVINCVAEGVKGNSPGVPVTNWIDVFLVEPSLTRGSGTDKRTDKDEIYLEIIGNTDGGSLGETAGSVIRRDVPYLIR